MPSGLFVLLLKKSRNISKRNRFEIRKELYAGNSGLFGVRFLLYGCFCREWNHRRNEKKGYCAAVFSAAQYPDMPDFRWTLYKDCSMLFYARIGFCIL